MTAHSLIHDHTIHACEQCENNKVTQCLGAPASLYGSGPTEEEGGWIFRVCSTVPYAPAPLCSKSERLRSDFLLPFVGEARGLPFDAPFSDGCLPKGEAQWCYVTPYYTEPPWRVEDIPEANAVIVSHNHYLLHPSVP
ncbi:hypothetical protein EDD85DRAFT_957438 [Armillaria nabsnona]|nr:hypothetical protein EDD85DRAFT_957438 [Armillaria nabsnona]